MSRAELEQSLSIVFMRNYRDRSLSFGGAGPEHGAPAFRLAEQGYDVWLGNFRGNTYSRAHLSLNPDVDNDYWRFTWDEMARRDLPAMLDYVMEQTGKEKIQYVGHSMGTTTFMVMNSLDQSWADKVELAVLLAPIGYVEHMASPIKYLVPFLGVIDVSLMLSPLSGLTPHFIPPLPQTVKQTGPVTVRDVADASSLMP